MKGSNMFSAQFFRQDGSTVGVEIRGQGESRCLKLESLTRVETAGNRGGRSGKGAVCGWDTSSFFFVSSLLFPACGF